jgi:HAD superfamily hydrolase (TIGR01509 family)
MAIKAIIFDLDGTLVDTERLWVEAMVNYLRELGCRCDSDMLMEIVYGRSWLDIYRDITRQFSETTGISLEKMTLVLSEHHKRLCRNEANLVIENSADLLRTLAATYPVIVVSGSPRADVIHNLGVADVLESVRFALGAEDYPHGKPDPSGFLKGAEMLGVQPDECLVFEDSWAGVSAAKAANMKCVALSRSSAHRQDVDHADIILADLAQFDPAMIDEVL